MSEPVVPSELAAAVLGQASSIVNEAGSLGIELAARIAAEFGRLVPRDVPADVARDPGRALRSAQMQLERSIAGVLEALGEAVDSYTELAGQAVAAMQARSSPGVETVVVSARPSCPSTTALWIHNTTADDAAGLALRPSTFVDNDGTVLEAAIEWSHTSNVRAAAHSTVPLSLTITPSADASAGSYHGLVLLTGVADALVHLRVDVALDVDIGAA